MSLGAETGTVVDGQCTSVGKNIENMEFCGRGRLSLSCMTCDKKDYKIITVEHEASAYTTQYKTIPLAGTNTEGWLGSWTEVVDVHPLSPALRFLCLWFLTMHL